MQALDVFHVRPAANLPAIDAELRAARDNLRHACRMRAHRDDRLNRAAVAAARGRIDHLLDRRLELTA